MTCHFKYLSSNSVKMKGTEATIGHCTAQQ